MAASGRDDQRAHRRSSRTWTARLADMDAQGVDVQLVSPSPSHFYPCAAEELAAAGRQGGQPGCAASSWTAPRSGSTGSAWCRCSILPCWSRPWNTPCWSCGLLGVEIGSFAATPADPERSTVELSDPRLEPFWSRAEELGAVVFLHPFGCILDERLDRFYLSNTVGQPAENAVALSHLIFCGVLDRHPDLKIVAAHGGGYLPTASAAPTTPGGCGPRRTAARSRRRRT